MLLCLEKKEFPNFLMQLLQEEKKHLVHLQDAIKKGYESYLLFLIQREDVNIMKIANDIDSNYYNEIIKAKKNGVKIIAYSCKVNESKITINNKVKVKI